PCTEDWDSMVGNDRVRFCQHCAKDVHNISNMTRKQAETLVLKSNGNLCLKYFQNHDGTPATAEDKGKLYRLTRRASRLAAGAFSVALSISSAALAQSSQSQSGISVSKLADTTEKKTTEDASGSISGTVTDPDGKPVAFANLFLMNSDALQIDRTESDQTGQYTFNNVPSGIYRLRVTSVVFSTIDIHNINVSARQTTLSDASMAQREVISVAGGIGIRMPSDLFVSAAAANNLESVKALLEVGMDVNKLDDGLGKTALYEAVQNNNLEMVKLLIAAGAKVNGVIVTELGSDTVGPLLSPAFSGIGQDTKPEIIDFLLQAGADPTQKDENGVSAIVAAADAGNTEILKKFIYHGLNINSTDSDGDTPLMLACSRGDLDSVKVLIAAGANVNLQNENGETALIQVDNITDPEIVKLLIGANAKLDTTDNTGRTALIAAASVENPGILQLLIDAGSDVNAADEDGMTTLIAAAQAGKLENLKVLLNNNANPNSKDKEGKTAIDYVVAEEAENKDEIIQLLKANGAIQTEAATLNVRRHSRVRIR